MPIEDALEKNKEATETVKQVAEDLAIVREVLDIGIPREDRAEDVEQAVEKTGEAEKRLSESAGQLEEVNEALERHVSQPGKGATTGR